MGLRGKGKKVVIVKERKENELRAHLDGLASDCIKLLLSLLYTSTALMIGFADSRSRYGFLER